MLWQVSLELSWNIFMAVSELGNISQIAKLKLLKIFETCIYMLILLTVVFIPAEFAALIQFDMTLRGDIQKSDIKNAGRLLSLDAHVT